MPADADGPALHLRAQPSLAGRQAGRNRRPRYRVAPVRTQFLAGLAPGDDNASFMIPADCYGLIVPDVSIPASGSSADGNLRNPGGIVACRTVARSAARLAVVGGSHW